MGVDEGRAEAGVSSGLGVASGLSSSCKKGETMKGIRATSKGKALQMKGKILVQPLPLPK